MSALTMDQANMVYDVLVSHAGASEDARVDFVRCQTKEVVTEYRFGGYFGFAGKFWNNHGWYVTGPNHREDPSGEKQSQAEVVNEILAILRGQYDDAT